MEDINVKYFKQLYIGSSKINGIGLFAGEKINCGEVVLSFGGVLAFQSNRFSGQYKSSTFVGISESIMLCELEDSEKDLSDYINHSCDPNVGMLDCLTVVAIKDINQGDEIVCDYAFWEADENWMLETECKCGSSNCRRKITGRDWMKITPETDNYKFYSPFLKRRIIKNAK